MTYVISVLKNGPDFLFFKLRIRDSRHEPCFPLKIKLLSNQIETNTLFKNIKGGK